MLMPPTAEGYLPAVRYTKSFLFIYLFIFQWLILCSECSSSLKDRIQLT